MTHRYWLRFKQNFGFLSQSLCSGSCCTEVPGHQSCNVPTGQVSQARAGAVWDVSLLLPSGVCSALGGQPRLGGPVARVCPPGRSACAWGSWWPQLGWLRLRAPRLQLTVLPSGKVSQPGDVGPGMQSSERAPRGAGVAALLCRELLCRQGEVPPRGVYPRRRSIQQNLDLQASDAGAVSVVLSGELGSFGRLAMHRWVSCQTFCAGGAIVLRSAGQRARSLRGGDLERRLDAGVEQVISSATSSMGELVWLHPLEIS